MDGERAGPRFALRFEEGRGLLSLAHPLRFAFGTIEVLELSLGPLEFPLDLSAGASRFRTRRTHVRAARARLDLGALLAEHVGEPYGLAPLAPLPSGLAWALTDPFGAVAFDTHARIEGPDLWVVLAGARSANEGPAPPCVRALAAARALGLELDDARGALRLPRILSAVLLEALVPCGWRVPDDRAVRVVLEVLGPRRLLLRTRNEGEDEPVLDDAPWEHARRLAPVLSALARGERDVARRSWDAQRERLGELPASLAREARALALIPAAPEGRDALSRTLELRAALREGRGADAVAHARALSEVEPCDAVAVEGLCAAADLVADAELAASLLEQASARCPRDARLALRLFEALARLGRPGALRAAIDAALASREPGPQRAELAREAAAICELAQRAEEAGRLWSIAAEGLPHDARVIEGLALVAARQGRHAAARELWDRAAGAHAATGEHADSARAWRRAASAAERAGELHVAEERLSRASEVAEDADALAALSRVRRAIGASAAALRAEARLLEIMPSVGLLASIEVAEALAVAAASALERGELERSRAFAGALIRARPDDARGADLLVRIDAHAIGAEPERILALEPARALAALASSDALALLSRIELDASSAERLALVAAGAPPELASIVAAVLAPWRSASHESDALTRARAAAKARDSAGLRAALAAAERAGDLDAARRIVDIALEVVGEGPARSALEAARERLGPP